MSPAPFNIDCRELTVDEQIALASDISDSLGGNGVALVNSDKIVVDFFDEQPDVDKVVSIVSEFIGRRKESQYYSIERVGDSLAVHSADPLAAQKRRPTEKLPPNLLKCPFCSFVTPYQELYNVHARSHGFY